MGLKVNFFLAFTDVLLYTSRLENISHSQSPSSKRNRHWGLLLYRDLAFSAGQSKFSKQLARVTGKTKMVCICQLCFVKLRL